MDAVQARIDDWLRAGLIDSPTADRLRQAEAERGPGPSTLPPPADAIDSPRSGGFSSVFGPGVSVGEMFAYLGIGFLLGAWTAFVARLAGESTGTTLTAAGLGIAAAGLMVLGVVLRSGDARLRRAAGVAFLASTGFTASAVAAAIAIGSFSGPLGIVLVAAAALIAAALFRRLHPALLTEFGLLSAVTGFGAAAMAWIESVISPGYDGFNGAAVAGFDPLGLVLLQAAGWLLVALALGLYALRVALASEGDPPAQRRATLIRAWAGLVAVLGLTTALTKQSFIGEDFRRVMEPWVADVAILALAIILVERAFRRDSGAFLFAAGVGFIAALTDFNFSYLTQTTEVGLLIEGVILLAVGFVADRLRRRLAAPDPEL